MTQVADSTRNRLIRAAERLFARRGIDGVSLREISRAAGAKNAAALQYYFDGRTGILRAILQKHWPGIDDARHAMLDEYDRSCHADLRRLAATLVHPAAEKLSDPDGGPEYIQLYNELHARSVPPLDLTRPEDWQDSIVRWRRMVRPLLDPNAIRLHRRYMAIRFASAELARWAASGPHAENRLFISHLIDLVAAILSTPGSDETIRLLETQNAIRNRDGAAAAYELRVITGISGNDSTRRKSG